MRDELRKTNINNKSRMIAGYCYPWNSQHDKTKYDIFRKWFQSPMEFYNR